MSYDDEELAELQRQRMAQMQQEAEVQKARQQADVQRQSVLASILSEEARSRLQNIKLAKPDYAAALENRLIQIAQSGQLKDNKITDDQLKQMLSQLTGSRREGSIQFKRK